MQIQIISYIIVLEILKKKKDRQFEIREQKLRSTNQ